MIVSYLTTLTSVGGVERLEENGEERGRVFAGVDDVRERQPSVAVTTQTLCKTEPRR